MVAANAGSLLIVDDEPSVRRALKRLLRNEGYQIQTAQDAEAAERILKDDAVDVIICDQDMPGTSGIEFLSAAARRFPQQRRLMISGRFQSEEVARAIDSGAIHKFMMKPWDDAILKADLRASFRHVMESFAGGTGGTASNDQGSGDRELSWAEFDEDRKLTRELHHAASNGSLSLQYQPQVDLATRSMSGVEALLRWEASIGNVRPDRFIGLAERSGAMTALTHWVVCEVCYRAEQWLREWPQGRVGMNVSPVDLRDDALVTYLEKLLAEHPIPPSSMQIEITESQAVNCDEGTLDRLNRLSEIGVELAIDDFGAGATTLSYLTDLPFTVLKLDRSLTQQLGTEKGNTIVAKVLEMASDLGMKTTVEGIETEEQAAAAQELGANTAQGYYFGKPTSHGDIDSWIRNGQPESAG